MARKGLLLSSATFLVFLITGQTPASAQALSLAPTNHYATGIFGVFPRGESPRTATPQEGVSLPAHLRRQVVDYPSREAAGTIVVDTANTYLYFVLGNGKALRYGIGVGRRGFTWSGMETVSRMAEWPDWHPPAEMIGRQPYLPRFIAGGPGNPLGARALYLGNTNYRIHGTNDPSTIGQRVSSGCIRMTNEDVIDLYGRAKLGSKVVVLPVRAPANPARVSTASVTPDVRTSRPGSQVAAGLY